MVKANENIKTKTTVKTTEKGKTINEVTKLTNPPINKPTTPKATKLPSPAPLNKAMKSPSPAPPNKATKSPSPAPPTSKTTKSPSIPSKKKEQPPAAQTSGTKLELKLEGFKKIKKGGAAYNIKLEATQQSWDETPGPKLKVFGRRGSRKAENRLSFDANIKLHAGKGTEKEELKEDTTAATTDPPTAKDIGTIDPKEAAKYSFLKKDSKGKVSTEEEQCAPASMLPEGSILTDFDLFEKSKKILNEDFRKLEEFFGKDKTQVAVPQKKQATTTKPAQPVRRSTSVAKSVNLKKSHKETINDARRKKTAVSLISKPTVLASILKGKRSARTTQKLPSKEG